jgi:hypothetical protein
MTRNDPVTPDSLALGTPLTTDMTASRLLDRWPTALGLVVATGVVTLILGLDVDDAASAFGPGAAAMMVIYLAAYAIGKPVSAWLAFVALIPAAAVQSIFGIDGAVGMTVILGLLWLWALTRGRAHDRYWFTVETSGLVFFGGLTIAAFAADARLAGVLAGIGWFTHGLWDAYHFAKDRVVSRTWSEMCAVVDIPVGAALIAVSIVG